MGARHAAAVYTVGYYDVDGDGDGDESGGCQRCGRMAELDGREPIVNTPPHPSRHPKRIRRKGIREKRAVPSRGA